MIRYRLQVADHTLFTTISRSRVEQERDRRAEFAPGAVITDEEVDIVGRFGSSVTDGHILWADGRTSPAWEFDSALVGSAEIALPGLLPPPASKLLSTIYGSDHASCAVVGGALVVATVVECETTVVAEDTRRTRGGFQSPAVERLDVVLADGSRHAWYAAVVGYSEGYVYELALTAELAAAELAGHDAQLRVVS